MAECYIRGSTIKYLRIPDEVIDMVKEEVQIKKARMGDNKPRNQQQQRNRPHRKCLGEKQLKKKKKK